MPDTAGTDTLPHCYRHPDRETGLACSSCGRPICTECMVQGPVGQRCPECAGQQRALRPRSMARFTPYVTYALMAANVLIFLGLEGGGVSSVSNSGAIDSGAVYAQAVSNGEWWRVVSAMFLHVSLFHLFFNMYALYVIGPVLERRMGMARYAALYFVSGICGSAGALVVSPDTPTVGASGAIFGLMGALFVIERRHGLPVMGGVGVFIVLNLAITFAVPGISIGGHIGGLIGGIAVGMAFEITASRRLDQIWGWLAALVMLAAAAAVTIVAVG